MSDEILIAERLHDTTAINNAEWDLTYKVENCFDWNMCVLIIFIDILLRHHFVFDDLKIINVNCTATRHDSCSILIITSCCLSHKTAMYKEIYFVSHYTTDWCCLNKNVHFDVLRMFIAI